MKKVKKINVGIGFATGRKNFQKILIGWVRYKPLLLYITQQDHYEERIEEMREKIAASLPNICAYFGRDDFMNVSVELEKYNRNVKKHYWEFLKTQEIWEKIVNSESTLK